MKKTNLTLLLLFLIFQCKQKNQPDKKDWPVYGGNSKANRYSALNQINTENVKELKVAWEYHTGDNPKENSSQIQCHPIIVKGIVYATSPLLKVLALDGATGKKIWSFDPFEKSEPQYHTNRGVVYWENEDDKRILFTAGSSLYALNAETGKLIPSFGENGKVNLLNDLDQDVSGLYVVPTTPGIVYKNLLILGARVSENNDAAPGHIRAYDILTGKRKWIFHTIPKPGEYGYETWPKNAFKTVGGVNVRACLSAHRLTLL
jgi:quinoprotein glucose dehydrogenase